MASILNLNVRTGFQEIICEYRWRIPNWPEIQQSKDSILREKIVIGTGGPAHQMSSWEIGFMPYPNRTDLWQLYCKLIDAPESLDELESTITIQWLNSSHNIYNTFVKQGKIKEGECLETKLNHYINNLAHQKNLVDSEGALNFTINLKIRMPRILASNNHVMMPVHFSKTFFSQVRNNIAALVEDPSSADIKIVTSDGIELSAHKFILKVQCPIFESMFRSHFSENVTGKVAVEDISGKTMKILLHYFYTGELLATWADEDTIVEFTYAAGKYQMTHVLCMLDCVLGTTRTTTDKNEGSSLDLQLLNVAHKLSLENAEARLVKRVMNKVAKVQNTADLLEFLGKIRI